ncbi:MAG: hypothetical protein KC910_30795 [Candidatus Eremiobacteraeota bacterium]|nr:hypothetical protein [Candidatus Eremiobacteraeota bacterium]
MHKKAWATPSLRQLNIRAATEASYPPGAPDNFATSDSLCPGGTPPTSGVFCAAGS